MSRPSYKGTGEVLTIGKEHVSSPSFHFEHERAECLDATLLPRKRSFSAAALLLDSRSLDSVGFSVLSTASCPRNSISSAPNFDWEDILQYDFKDGTSPPHIVGPDEGRDLFSASNSSKITQGIYSDVGSCDKECQMGIAWEELTDIWNHHLDDNSPYLRLSKSFNGLSQTEADLSISDIEMVWPPCLSVNTESQLSDLTIILSKPKSAMHGCDSYDTAADAVLVMSGCSMDLVVRAPVKQGRAHCQVPKTQLSGGMLSRRECSKADISSSPDMASIAPMHTLTLFAMDSESGATGPATCALCASPEVADELNRYFLGMADKLLSLDSNPSQPLTQLRDLHGYTYLPNNTFHSCSSECSHESDASQCLQSSQTSVTLDQRPWKMTSDMQHACHKAWSQHFQPLVHELTYLLMCVPVAFSDQMGDDWDHQMYCKTLARMMAFLEHHKCWHSLAVLLDHACSIRVDFCFQGEPISRSSISAEFLERLLRNSLHDDVSIQYNAAENDLCLDSGFLSALGSFDSRASHEARFHDVDSVCGPVTPTLQNQLLSASADDERSWQALSDFSPSDFKSETGGAPFYAPGSWADIIMWSLVALMLFAAIAAVQDLFCLSK